MSNRVLLVCCVVVSALGLVSLRAQDRAGQKNPSRKPAVAQPVTIDKLLSAVDAALEGGRFAEALTTAEKLMADHPEDARTYVKTYDVYVASGRKSEADAFLNLTVQKFPDNGDVLFMAGRVALDAGNLEKAEQFITHAAQSTDDESVRETRTALLADITARREAASQRQAIADDKKAQLLIIEKRVADGAPDQARTALDALLMKYPGDADLLFAASQLLARMGKFDEAADRLNRSIELTTDPDVARLRRLQIAELNYQREKAADAARRQAIALEIKRITLLVRDGNSKDGLGALERILTANEKDGDVHLAAHDVYAEAGDFVAAEFHLKKAIELTQNTQVANAAKLALVELQYKREKAAAQLAERLWKALYATDFTEAVKLAERIDKVALYDQRAYLGRAALLGIYRKYADAVKIYNRVLEDQTLTPASKSETQSLREYCITRATHDREHAAGKYCHFCGAALDKRAAYCHVCLSFQYPVKSIKSGDATTNYSWSDGALQSVKWSLAREHGVKNGMKMLLGAATAVASKTAVNVATEEAFSASREFSFSYVDRQPARVSFRSAANGGEVTTMTMSSYGNTGTAGITGQQGGVDESSQMNDVLLYPTHPGLDTLFGGLALKQNLSRGMSGNQLFHPFVWAQPTLFAFIYDAAVRVVKAVPVYMFSNTATAAGNLTVTERKRFVGPGHADPAADPEYVEVLYGADGLIAGLKRMIRGHETARRMIQYDKDGIREEKMFVEGKEKGKIKYDWNKGQLVSAESKVDDTEGLDVTFLTQPVSVRSSSR